MEMNGVSLHSTTSSMRTMITTSHVKARRVATWVGLAIVASIASGALQAEEPQAIGTWVSVGEAGSLLAHGAIVALPDKRTLIVGGQLADGTLTDAVTIYDPVAKSAIVAGRLTSVRMDHTATLLKDGRLLVVGGITADGRVSSEIEVFDPPTGTSTIVALLPEPRSGHVAAALLDGTILIAGGATVDVPAWQTAVLFDPSTAAVSSVPSQLQSPRVHASATTLLDGRVLVVGGSDGTTDLASAEIYERYSQSFAVATTAMSVGRQGHAAVLLPDNGGVLVAGGTSNGMTQTSVDLFLPAVFPDPFSYGEGEFTATGAMTAARAGAVAGPTSVEGYAFAAGGGSAGAEVYRYATIKTDKDDYAPGELATITGWGWQANEEVTLLFQEDPAVHDDYVVKVHADSNGYLFWNEWAPEHHDVGVRFYLTATDSRSRAQMTFTDASKVGAVSVGSQTGILTSGTPGSATYTITVNRDGNGNFDATLTVINGLPSGVTASFSPATLNFSPQDNSKTSTLTLQTTATTPAGASSFTVRAAASGSDFVDKVGTLTIGQPAQSPTTTTVTCPSSVGYSGAAQTPCTAFATGSGGFKQALTVSYTANITVGLVTASASFQGDASHSPSAGSATFTIEKANAVCTVSGYSGVFNGAAHGASGSCAGATDDPSATGSTLDLGAKFTNAPGGTAHWTFTGGTNYNNTAGDVAITISKATATLAVEGYSGVYDGAAHGATGTAKGVLNETLAGLNLGASFSNVPGGMAHWVFADVTGNYNNAAGDVAITISKATATLAVEGYSGVYDGASHGATGTAKGVLSEALAGLNLGTSFTNVPGGQAHWAFTDVTGNYNNAEGDIAITISKANATLAVDGYSGVYDGAAHGATGTAKGVLSETLAGLNLGTSFTNVPGGTAHWAFTDVTGNYHNAEGDVAITVSKANATLAVDGYSGVYDGAAHGATGTAKGVLGEALGGLNLGVTFTNVPGGTAHWVFTDVSGNYDNAEGDIAITIIRAIATVHVTGYSGTYDGAEHGGTGSAKGVVNEPLAGLNLGQKFIDAPGGTAHWTFTDINYEPQSGDVPIVITKASSTTTVNCPLSVTYAGEALTPCSVTVLGAGSLNSTASATYTNNVNAGTATASYDFAGDTNHTGSSNSTTFVINRANPVIAVQGYTGVYDGLAHGATGSAVGVKGESLAGLSLGNSFTNVPGGTAQWTFTDVTGNYNYQSGTATIVIGKADPTVTVTGYNGVYDAQPHGAYGYVKGVRGEALAGLNLGASFTNVPGGTAHWAFTDPSGNYNNGGGDVAIVIEKATATCTITGYDVIFDNASHTATGQCIGVANSVLAGLDLSKTTHMAAGFYTDTWTFTDVTGNYHNTNSTTVDRIGHWTTSGFYQPVDMSGPQIVWNTIKGGSTVPLKFNLYAGSATKTSVGDVSGFGFAPAPCEVSMIDSAVEFTTTGGTQLRYDGTAGQFIQNWQTPKTAGKCYAVQLTALDGSTIVAYFKTK